MSTRFEPPSPVGILLLGAAAFALLPWFSISGGLLDLRLPAALIANRETASGLFEALLFGRWSLAGGLVALALACWPVSVPGRFRGRWMACWSLAGCLWILFDASRAWGPAHAGLGLGAAVLLVSLLLVGGLALPKISVSFAGQTLSSCIAVFSAAALLVFVVYPLARGLSSTFMPDGGNAAWAAFLDRIATERIWGVACLMADTHCGVVWNTVFLGLLTATGAMIIGTLLAFAEVRGRWRAAAAIRALAPVPFVVPPFMTALVLVLLFGRSGLVTQALQSTFGLPASRVLYGLPGLWLSQLVAFSPATYLIIRAALLGMNPAIEESARAVGASAKTILARVTLPLLSRALGQAFLLGFVESVADFGTPIVVGGSYDVLSTEIFFAIVGAQFDAGRAASLALLLSCVSLGVFAGQRSVLRDRPSSAPEWRRQAERAPLPAGIRAAACAMAAIWVTLTLLLYAGAACSAFVELWGRDFQPTLRHFRQVFGIAQDAGGWVLTGFGWTSLFTSLRLSAIAGAVAAVAGIAIAWLLETTRFEGRRAIELFALAALTVPGTVLGLCYMLVFDGPPILLTGTQLIIVLCFVFRCLPVCVGMGTTALRDIGTTLHDASRVAGAPATASLLRVYLPLIRHAVAAALIYSFVRSMTTVSAVVFLVNAETDLATTFIIGRVGRGDYGEAFAYGFVVVLILTLFMAAANRWGAGHRIRRSMRAAHHLPATP